MALFKNEEDSEIVALSINYELMSIMLCYELSFEKDVLEQLAKDVDSGRTSYSKVLDEIKRKHHG